MKRMLLKGLLVVIAFFGAPFNGQYEGYGGGHSAMQSGGVLQELQRFLVGPASATTVYEEVIWDDLIPKKWFGEIKAQMGLLGRLGFLVDGSEEADAAMQRLRKKWDEAPIEPRFINKAIKIPGYVVALDANRKMINEFLLVPYFGACIHTPPPPANQIILVRLDKPIKRIESMETVWVEGVLKDARVDTGIAVTGYALNAQRVYPYTEK